MCSLKTIYTHSASLHLECIKVQVTELLEGKHVMELYHYPGEQRYSLSRLSHCFCSTLLQEQDMSSGPMSPEICT